MKIKIHPLFFIFGLYFAITGKVFLFLTFTLTALIHEYGHAVILSKLGYKMNNISLMPYGAVINGNIVGISYKDEIKVAFAGPLLNLFIATLFIALWWVAPSLYAYTDTIVLCNLSICALNFLPAWPLDGGRIFSATLSLYIRRKTAVKITRWVGFILSSLLFALFVYSIIKKATNISILFFALFMLTGALSKSKENTYIRIFERGNLQNCKIKECKKLAVNQNIILKKLIASCDSDSLFTFDLVDEKGKITSLDLETSQNILSSYRLYDKVGDVFKDEKEHKNNIFIK